MKRRFIVVLIIVVLLTALLLPQVAACKHVHKYSYCNVGYSGHILKCSCGKTKGSLVCHSTKYTYYCGSYYQQCNSCGYSANCYPSYSYPTYCSSYYSPYHKLTCKTCYPSPNYWYN